MKKFKKKLGNLNGIVGEMFQTSTRMSQKKSQKKNFLNIIKNVIYYMILYLEKHIYHN